MALPNLYNVAVATVTYAERFNLLEQVLSRLIDLNVSYIIVIDNGCPYDVADTLKTVFPDDQARIIVSRMEQNDGSASGFSAAIRAAHQCSQAEYLWLLDDDNLPHKNALDNIFSAYSFINDERVSLLSLREDRKEFTAAYKDGYWNNAIFNSFQSFHIIERLCKQRYRNCAHPLVPIEYAPYGGFFFNINWVAKIGYPDLSYGLYGDDHEYTYRITKNGGLIYLCGSSVIVDIERSWFLKDQNSHRFFIDGVDKARLYKAIKNRVRFECEYLVKNKFTYFTNMLIYLSGAFIISMIRNPLSYKNVPTILNAIKDGTNESS